MTKEHKTKTLITNNNSFYKTHKREIVITYQIAYSSFPFVWWVASGVRSCQAKAPACTKVNMSSGISEDGPPKHHLFVGHHWTAALGDSQ